MMETDLINIQLVKRGLRPGLYLIQAKVESQILIQNSIGKRTEGEIQLCFSPILP